MENVRFFSWSIIQRQTKDTHNTLSKTHIKPLVYKSNDFFMLTLFTYHQHSSAGKDLQYFLRDPKYSNLK